MNQHLAIQDEAKQIIQAWQAELTEALPTTIPFERLMNVFKIACANNPKILECDKESVRVSLLRAATDNLMPDNREAAIVPYNTKVKGPDGRDVWKQIAQYMPMVQGVRKRALELGGVRIESEVVYEKDSFDAEFGDAPYIKHKPAPLGTDRGEIVGAYAIFKDANGVIIHREAMGWDEIMKTRDISRAKDGPGWTRFAGEMARKTVVRRGSKSIPTLDEKLRVVIEAEDAHVDFALAPPPHKHAIDHNPLLDQPRQRTAPADMQEAMDSAARDTSARSSAGSEQRTSNPQATGSSPVGQANDSSSDSQNHAPETKSEDVNQSGGAPERLPTELFDDYAKALARMATETSIRKAHTEWWSGKPHPTDGSLDFILANQIYQRNLGRVRGTIPGEGFPDEIEALIAESYQ